MIMLLWNCSPQKRLTDDASITPPDKESILEDIFKVKDSDWFAAKAKVKFTDNTGTQKANLYLRMKTDSVIWMVFKKHSVEAARILINEDSLFIIYRFEKNYQAEALSDISNIYGFYPDFDFLQHTLWGRLPGIDSSRYWQQKESENSYDFRTMKDDILIDFSYDKLTGKLISGSFMDKYSLNGNWDYSDYRKVQTHEIPFERKFHINFDDENFLELEIDFSEIQIGTPYDLKFEIPAHYSRIRY